MRRFVGFIIFCTIIFSSSWAPAKFYKYKDKNGVIIFTDDLSEVPQKLRSTVKTFKSITDNKKKQKTDGGFNSPGSFTRKSKVTSNSVKVQKQKEWLINEQQKLNQKKKELVLLRKSINTPAKQKAYNDMVIKLNKRIDIFRRNLINFNESIAP